MSFTPYPAIDLKGGQVVRLKRGDMAQATVYGDPATQADRPSAERKAESGRQKNVSHETSPLFSRVRNVLP